MPYRPTARPRLSAPLPTGAIAPPTRPGCGPDLPTALRHRARRPSAPAPALALQHRPTIPADPRAAASAHDPRRSPRGSIGPRSPPIPTRQHRPTIPADPHVAASAHRLPRRSPAWQHRPTIPARSATWQHRPTIPTRSATWHRPIDPHRLAARGSIGPSIPTRLTARGSIGPSIPARRRPTGSRPVAASAIDPRAASAHRLTARGSIGYRSPRRRRAHRLTARGSIGYRSPRGVGPTGSRGSMADAATGREPVGRRRRGDR